MPDAAGSDRLLACDLDGTLIRVNSFPHFLRFLAWRTLRAGRLLALARLLLSVAGRRLGVVTHVDLKSMVCRLGETVPTAAVLGWAQHLVRRHGVPDAVALVEGWSGRVLITTAAPEVYARHIGAVLDVPVVQGSVLRDGALLNNESEQKPARLRELGVERIDLFLTDDVVIDGPVAALADVVLVVAPDGTVRPWRSHRAVTEPEPS